MIIAANWKMNKNPKESQEFIVELLDAIHSSSELGDDKQKDFIIFAPAINLTTVGEALSHSQVGWGAQNVHYECSGAFTGENSPELVAELGATHALVGHSERRSLFQENNDLLEQKFKTVQSLDMVPMLCVGEILIQREQEKTEEVISHQLRKGLSLLDQNKNFIIAYEPVWAIGTGKTAHPEQAEEAHQVLRKVLTELVGVEKASATPILYGGSVKPDNAEELSKKSNINGFLIGGASLKVDSFISIAENAQK